MTNVSMRFSEDSIRASVKGHAGYSKNGEPDIVCAACSTLTFTMAQSLRTMETHGELIDFYFGQFDDGCAEIYSKSKPRDEAKIKLKSIAETIMFGFLMLQEKYPSNVRLELQFDM